MVYSACRWAWFSIYTQTLPTPISHFLLTFFYSTNHAPFEASMIATQIVLNPFCNNVPHA
ncbi:hypothetical protein SERLA73DRAFT_186881 [Serpula lacrymans var. lacrymans S7.3]|uniref:Uncharacterized protein n=2 Tax=Serpula lacrymans var. lacrymans TaxID=341189 RepID=F8Q811_SERL3|nr:uncharacterized protein SERLADRAFT_476153 [Serpula lacrymans var. lacrymans S7.9]EGN95699.1 hypothetical protein SERLA73DRAFT_186881 [Serpula lacrymans var. lacrymans S7.3]EGO21225.1 hypothetical protein SERLADRAFT_476153 [Serpula lacrymans var. lacrymans S7.9]